MLSVEDKLDIGAVATEFFVALDRFDYERLLSLLTEDIEWIRPGGTLRGWEDVSRTLKKRDQNRATRHLVCNMVIKAESEGLAQVSMDLLVYQRELSDHDTNNVLIGPTLLGTNDVLRREGGVWKIAIKCPQPVFGTVS